MSKKIFDLGSGLELWEIGINEIVEQDVNARAMTDAQFRRLTETIKRDNRLESLPLLAATDRGIEVISGHHRTRTARAAGLANFYGLVDTTGLTAEQIATKQLAHNSLQGRDNDQLVAQIYGKIKQADLKLEAFIPDLSSSTARVQVDDIQVPFQYKSIGLVFLPVVEGKVVLVLEKLKEIAENKDAIWLASEAEFDTVKTAMHRVISEYEVRVVANAVGKMAELASQQMGDAPEESEGVSLRDIFGVPMIPKEPAIRLKAAIDKLKLPRRDKWKALLHWALGEPIEASSDRKTTAGSPAWPAEGPRVPTPQFQAPAEATPPQAGDGKNHPASPNKAG